jgi:hypothetical protein
VTSEHVCYFRGDSRSTAELVADKTICSTCTLYLIRRYMMFAHATMKALCLLAVGVIIGTAISLFFRSRRAQSKARGEEGDGLSDGLVKGSGAAGLIGCSFRRKTCCRTVITEDNARAHFEVKLVTLQPTDTCIFTHPTLFAPYPR